MGLAASTPTADFFRHKRTDITIELVTTGTSPTYDSYTHTDPDVTQWHKANLVTKTPLIREFEADLMTGAAEYAASKLSQCQDERRAGYDKFFNHPENMRRAREIQATYTRPPPDPAILSRLMKMITYAAKTHPADVKLASRDGNISLEDAIFHVELDLDVHLDRRNLGSLRLQFLNWYNQWGLQRFDVIDGVTHKHVGSIIVHQSKTLPPTTTPLLTEPPLQIVNTTGGYNLVHALTHAVNFSFVPSYKIPRDLIEIAPMCMENSARWCNDDSLSPNDLTRQAALAIADLTANTPDEFNEIFAKHSNTHPVGHVRARMWHFTNMPFKYYSYAVGMGAKNYRALPNAVRSSKREDILALTE